MESDLQMESELTTPCSEPLDLDTIRSRVRELEDTYNSDCKDEGVSEALPSDSGSDQLLQDCALQLQSSAEQIISDCSDLSFLGIEDLDLFLEHLQEELHTAEAESAKISSEIEVLSRTHVEDSRQFESNIEELNCLLDFVSSQELAKEKTAAHMDCSSYGEDQSNSNNTGVDHEFEILKLENQIEESKTILRSLQDLDSVFKRFDAIEQIEDALSGVKVIEFNGNCIRLSMQTYVPKLEDILCQKKIVDTSEPSEVNHEMLIEIDDGNMEIKNVEMFPNDVFIGDVIDAAKSFRQLFPQSELMEKRSSFEWFVRKVQDRILQCTLRHLVVRDANKSRHSFEYSDRDEIVVAHLDGGVDAFLKVTHGWPISGSPLNLVSLKSSDYAKEISLSILCKVEEAAKSLAVHTRQNLSSFVDAVEKLLAKQIAPRTPF